MKEIEASVRAALEHYNMKEVEQLSQTTQLVKTRYPPIWSGQSYKRWKMEVERWSINNKASEEEKYIDLYKSLKKNDIIKYFVHRTLVKKVDEVRTVKRIIEVMTEKYLKTKSERILELMKKISYFKMDENVETLLDRFDELIMEVDKERLAENLKYAC